MTVLVDASVSGTYANSYVSIAYADQYFDQHYDTSKTTTWTALSDDQKQTLLVESAILIDSLRFTYNLALYDYNYEYDQPLQKVVTVANTTEPVRYSVLQNMQFPRNIDIDPNTGQPFIPEPIKLAQCEQAIFLKSFSDTAVAKIQTGVTSEEVEIAGQIRKAVTYQGFRGPGGVDTSSAAFAPLAVQYVSAFLIRNPRLRRA
jgi:hypothetical protein